MDLSELSAIEPLNLFFGGIMLARQIAIGFGIAVFFPMLVFYGVGTLTHRPVYAEYTKNIPPFAANEAPEQRMARAQAQKAAGEAFRSAQQEFAKKLILAAVPLGMAAILIGSILKLNSIGAGLMFGGLFSIGLGYFHYWQYLADWALFVSALAGLVVFLVVGLRLMKNPPG